MIDEAVRANIPSLCEPIFLRSTRQLETTWNLEQREHLRFRWLVKQKNLEKLKRLHYVSVHVQRDSRMTALDSFALGLQVRR